MFSLVYRFSSSDSHWVRRFFIDSGGWFFLLTKRDFIQSPAAHLDAFQWSFLFISVSPTFKALYQQLHVWRSSRPRGKTIVISWHVIGSRNLNYRGLIQRPNAKLSGYGITFWRSTSQWPSQYKIISGVWHSRLGLIPIVPIPKACLLRYIFSFDLFYHSSNDDSREELSAL